MNVLTVGYGAGNRERLLKVLTGYAWLFGVPCKSPKTSVDKTLCPCISMMMKRRKKTMMKRKKMMMKTTTTTTKIGSSHGRQRTAS